MYQPKEEVRQGKRDLGLFLKPKVYLFQLWLKTKNNKPFSSLTMDTRGFPKKLQQMQRSWSKATPKDIQKGEWFRWAFWELEIVSRKSATMGYNPYFCLAVNKIVGPPNVTVGHLRTLAYQPVPVQVRIQAKLSGREARQTGKQWPSLGRKGPIMNKYSKPNSQES